MTQQTTLSGEVSLSGVALHSGHQVAARLLPAPTDHGIVFSADGVQIPAQVDRVVDTQLATTLGCVGTNIRTVEHLLATLMGLGIDNALVEVEGGELPVLDGCAEAWVRAIRGVGICEQGSLKRVLEIQRPVEFADGERWARLEPHPGLSIDVTIDFDHPGVGRQQLALDLSPDCFEAELAWARTFGFERHVPAMRRMGLVRGGSLENALVFGAEGALNPGGLKQADEPVRHKMLDAMGDLALLGSAVRGRLVAQRPGHGLIIGLVRLVLSQLDAWELREDGA